MKVSVLIPTFNEVNNIGKVLDEIPKDSVSEVLIIDGHSNDGTVEMVKKLGYPVIFQKNKGFGSAVSEGMQAIGGEVAVLINGDYSQNPKDIPLLLKKIEEGYDFVMASRYLPGSGSADDTVLHYLGNRLFTHLCNFIHGSHYSDTLYFFFAVKKRVFEKIKVESPGFEYCMELPIKIHKAGFKIAQIPSFERKRTTGQAKVKAFSDGWKILKAIFKH
ncbi:MAG: glycosyltransferase family 2 protein [Candidatus Nealsonbacteria bacterium]|nr:glycosyltransferase family 2 protein [Candidatus Nealsonbacteria bacterium]